MEISAEFFTSLRDLLTSTRVQAILIPNYDSPVPGSNYTMNAGQ